MTEGRSSCTLAVMVHAGRKIAILAIAASVFPMPTRAADASHDFDFDFGTWKTHIRRLLHPRSSSTGWVRYEGTVTVRKVWGGRANVEEIEADGTGQHLEFLNVRMYDPQGHQWRLNGANGTDGTLGPPMVGAFRNGRGVFYDQELFEGRIVLVRQAFFNITQRSYSFEQAFSGDGGRMWEPNFVASLDRINSDAISERAGFVANTSHDFDFNYGTWATHISSLKGSTGAPLWVALSGTVAVRKIWNGRALMEEIKASNARSSFEGLTLYLYTPQSRQWSQTYADSSDGTFERSMTGTFHDGRGELVSQDTYGTQMVLLRDVWSNIAPDAHHFEIQVSRDGGRTWRPTFVANLTRIGPGL